MELLRLFAMAAQPCLIVAKRFRSEFIAQFERLEQAAIVNGMFGFFLNSFPLNRDGLFQFTNHVAAEFKVALPKGIDAGLNRSFFFALLDNSASSDSRLKESCAITSDHLSRPIMANQTGTIRFKDRKRSTFLSAFRSL